MSDPYAQPPRPAEEPPSQPFQPMSYDLAPEFSPSPSAPPPASSPPASSPPASSPPASFPPASSPPFSPAQPPYGSPPQSYAAPAPAYPSQPTFGPPPAGFPPSAAPPPAPRKRRGLAITLSVIGGVLLLCGVLSCVFAFPVISESGAKISAPTELPGGLTKDTSTSMQQSLDELERQFKSEISATDAVAGFYNDSAGHQVLLVAATGLILFPDSEVNDAFKNARDDEFQIGDISDQDPGKLGGTARCGSGKIGDVSMTACIWADHGCAGAVFFLERDVAESTNLFIPIREAVQTR